MTQAPTRKVSLVGVPTDIGAADRGASMGPEALRVAGIAQALTARGVDVEDRGNVSGPQNPFLPPVKGYRHLEEVVAWNRAAMDALAGVLADGRMPIMLGGDHCLGVGSITAVANHCRKVGKKLRVIWFDAHTDCNTSELTPSGNIHGMPVACLCGNGPQGLTELGGRAPAIDPSVMRYIGIRSVDDGEKRLVHDMGMHVFDMRYIDEHGMRKTVEAALEGVDENTHVHLSFDVDGLDPSIAPGVGTTVRGGPSYREAQLAMEMIHDCGRLGSLDLVELNPAFDDHNRTAKVAVELVESLFGKSTLIRE
ncbi:MAG TPA: arginase [Rhodanobacteraceae bacterium]